MTTALNKCCPVLDFKEVITMDLDPKTHDADCCICLGSLVGASWRGSRIRKITSCGHVFHAECIAEWLTKNSPTCPLCRKHSGYQDEDLIDKRNFYEARPLTFEEWLHFGRAEVWGHMTRELNEARPATF